MPAKANRLVYRVRNAYIVSTISIALLLFLLGGVGYMLVNILSETAKMREGVTMIVELKNSLSESERNAVAEKLAESDMVTSLKFVSKEEKLSDEEFTRAFAVDVKAVLGENPLPDSFDVKLSALASNEEALAAFVEEASKIEGVTHITYPKMFLGEMHSALDVMQLVVLIVGGALLLVSLLLVGNTVRLAVYSERELINVLKAVGATRWFIVKPFLIKGLLVGAVAGVVATVLLVLALYGVDYALPDLGIASQVELIAIVAGIMVAVGVVIAVVATLITVNRFVSMKTNKIHLY